MCIVVGKTCKRCTKDNALEFVAGYTVAHDVSARDWQLEKNGGQWLMGKTFDTHAPIGPAIVTTDELADIHNKGIRCRLNGTSLFCWCFGAISGTILLSLTHTHVWHTMRAVPLSEFACAAC